MLALAAGLKARVEIAHDYSIDFELLEYAVRDAGLRERVRDVVLPVNVAGLNETMEGELAAEACYVELGTRGLERHHTLAEGPALRAACVRVKGIAKGASHVR